MIYAQLTAAAYAIAFVALEIVAMVKSGRYVGWVALTGALKGWRIYVDAFLVVGVVGFAAAFPIGARAVWFGAADEPYIDRAFIRESRIHSLWCVPLVGFNAAYALQPGIWNSGA